ncbi:MAG: hypothetical protein KKF41_10730 [Actinobacteria bacterium]|nr:hypothetical protein [Actinomycetota bacterium]MBU1942187.1 hypothetical protein [Actinomycetota bacterium]MBU2688048.1 hypothetical protein [Actinomycetota bacterium]
MTMRYCPRCGVPRMLSNEHRWDPSGTISLARDASHRMVILDNDALDHVLDSISERIGMPLDQIIVEAKRKSARHFMEALLSGVKGVVVRKFAGKKVYEQLAKQVNMLGSGNAVMTEYRRHQFLDGAVTDAFNGPCIAGDICGAFESVEGCTAGAEFHYDPDGILRIRVSQTEGLRPEYEDRFSYVPRPALSGRNIYELCPVCHAPLALGDQYSFDMDRGVIREDKTGHRVILIGVMTLNNIFGELAGELGEEIPHMIMEIERDRVAQVIREKGKDLDSSEQGYLRYARTLQLRGMGNGSEVRTDGESITVRIDNPYFEPLIAGFIAGFYEATSGKAADASWTEATPGYSEITVKPA